MSMKTIDQDVPAGKTLIAGPIEFRGPCIAKAGVSDSVDVKLIDTPKAAAERTPEQVAARAARQVLRSLDAALPRVVEDLIDTLVSADVIKITDLPDIVQQRLAAKSEARAVVGAP